MRATPKINQFNEPMFSKPLCFFRFVTQSSRFFSRISCYMITTFSHRYYIPFSIMFLLCIFLAVKAQVRQPRTNLMGWEIFSTVKFKSKYYKAYKESFLTPEFDSQLLSLEGSVIQISGHYMPLDLPDRRMIILSRYPYSACFFCGGAGPESVIEVHFPEKAPKPKPDQVIAVQGKLKLNNTDVEHLNFILTDAEQIKP